ncbi:phospholipase A2 [Nakamurella endophytica]|uniref:Phospholipase n=1 Tax=Nakamurella endophytica TaxID=1748367 RepID=A0A917SV80_9ACTN|nr:phospholipase A2 [Nakamurella endophytica]GGL98019.1 hypothetical protein GCM10011594_17390 [Nakamurella endophytica]
MRIWQRAVIIPALALALLGGSVTAAEAAPSRATLKAAASKVEYETVGGSNYGHYKKKYPTQLNWTKDGCSVPKAVWISPALALVLAHYSGVFKASCDRHDFGYRNYGKASGPGVRPKFDPTRARKNSIDSRFRSNMRVQCQREYGSWWEIGAKEACYKAADVYYTAVSLGGDKAFFG